MTRFGAYASEALQAAKHAFRGPVAASSRGPALAVSGIIAHAAVTPCSEVVAAGSLRRLFAHASATPHS